MIPNSTNNVIENQQLQDTTKHVLTQLHSILARSYGPLGENTIISRGNDAPTVTKDGLTILRAIRFDNKEESDIYKLVCSISSTLVEKVGDGSTSAVISAKNLYENLVDVRKKYKNGRKFNKALQYVQELLRDTINLYLTRKLSGDPEEKRKVLSQIAGVSNNNDFDIGAKIAEVMSHCDSQSIIRIKDSPVENGPIISHTLTSGFAVDKYRLNHGLYFTGEKTKHGFETSNSYVFMTYNMLEVHYKFLLEKVIPAMQTPSPIVIIAETVQKEVADQITKDAFYAVTKGNTPAILLVETGDLSSLDAISRFTDLQAYVNANAGLANTITDTNDGDGITVNDVIGHATKVSFLPNNTITFEAGAGYRYQTEQFNAQLKQIQTEFDETPPSQKIHRGALRARLARMNGVTATIYVGGRTQEEKETTRYLVDDSVSACQSVLKHGYTLGANLAPYYASMLLFAIDAYNIELIKEMELGEELESIFHRLTDVDWNIVEAVLQAYKATTLLPIELGSVELSEDDSYILAMNKYTLSANPVENTYPIFNSSDDNVQQFDLNLEIENLTSVISPVSTDIEILNTTFSIVTLLLTSNQYIA